MDMRVLSVAGPGVASQGFLVPAGGVRFDEATSSPGWCL